MDESVAPVVAVKRVRVASVLLLSVERDSLSLLLSLPLDPDVRADWRRADEECEVVNTPSLQ